MFTYGNSRESALILKQMRDIGMDQWFFGSDRMGEWSLWRVAVADGEASGPAELVKRQSGPLKGIGFTSDNSLYYKIGGKDSDVFGAELDTVTGNVSSAPKPVIERFMGSNANPAWSPNFLHKASCFLYSVMAASNRPFR